MTFIVKVALLISQAVCWVASGFAFGRIKNQAKLAAIRSELFNIETYACGETRSMITRIRKAL